MPAEFTGDARTTRAVGIARAHSGGSGQIGTHHLLIGLAVARSDARELLEATEVTRPALVSALRRRGEQAEGDSVEVRLPETGTTERVSVAAAAALDAYLADARQEPQTLLAAVLRDEGSFAAAMVRECGADVAGLRRAAETREIPQLPERVPPALRGMRDRLLGRAKYRNPGLRNVGMALAVAMKPNWARTPVLWAKFEAEEVARQRGGRVRTDDLLIAVLAAHEIAAAYPHLRAEAAPDAYAGTQALVATGLTAARLTEAAAALPESEVPAKDLLRYGRSFPVTTSALLDRLLADENNRSVLLLRSLGVDVEALRP